MNESEENLTAETLGKEKMIENNTASNENAHDAMKQKSLDQNQTSSDVQGADNKIPNTNSSRKAIGKHSKTVVQKLSPRKFPDYKGLTAETLGFPVIRTKAPTKVETTEHAEQQLTMPEREVPTEPSTIAQIVERVTACAAAAVATEPTQNELKVQEYGEEIAASNHHPAAADQPLQEPKPTEIIGTSFNVNIDAEKLAASMREPSPAISASSTQDQSAIPIERIDGLVERPSEQRIQQKKQIKSEELPSETFGEAHKEGEEEAQTQTIPLANEVIKQPVQRVMERLESSPPPPLPAIPKVIISRSGGVSTVTTITPIVTSVTTKQRSAEPQPIEADMKMETYDQSEMVWV